MQGGRATGSLLTCQRHVHSEEEKRLMGPKINFAGQHIKATAEELQPSPGTFALLADIDKPISIPPGGFQSIPLPIQAQGDGQTLIALTIEAGKADSDNKSIRGQFCVPSQFNFEPIDAIVTNNTSAILIINPKNLIGYMEFIPIGQEDAEEEQHSNTSLPIIPTVYKPQNIDSEIKPEYATAGAAAMDMRADLPEALEVKPGERVMIPTGIFMAIPDGYEAQVRPRSGLAAKHGITITNSPGTIDSDYRGEIKVIFQNTGDDPFTVEPGERIAQLLIAPVVQARLDFCAELDDTARGDGGFGSTGRN